MQSPKTVKYKLLLKNGKIIESVMPLDVCQEIVRRAKSIEPYKGFFRLIDGDMIIHERYCR